MKEVTSAYDRGIEYTIVPPILVSDDMPVVSLTRLLAYRLSPRSPQVDVTEIFADESRLAVLSGQMLGCSYNQRAKAFTEAVGGVVEIWPA